MTDQIDIADLRAKLAAVRYRPWQHQPYGGQNQNGDYSGGSVFDEGGEYVLSEVADAEGALIVAAVNALPALLDEIERHREAVRRAKLWASAPGGADEADILELRAILSIAEAARQAGGTAA